MKRILRRIFDAAWLPLLLIAGTTWLFAPLVNADHIGHLQVISVYEGTERPLAWLFRGGDFIAAAVITAAVLRSGLLRRRRWLAIFLLGYAGLSVIDILFGLDCFRNCSQWEVFSHHVHDIESGASLFVLAAATISDAIRRGRWLSRTFLVVQVLVGAALLLPVVPAQTFIFTQYIYQTAVIAWIAYILRAHMPAYAKPWSHARTLMAGLLALAGVLEIVAAFNIRFHEFQPLFLAQHSVLAGVVMLYMARQLYQGQRRAAYVTAVVLGTVAAVYSLITPHVLPLAAAELLLVMLWYNSAAFFRNIGVPPILYRLRTVGFLLGGLVIAGLLLTTVSFATGRQQHLERNVVHLFDASSGPIKRTRNRGARLVHEHRQFQAVSATLGAVTVALIVWILFRPASQLGGQRIIDEAEAAALLERFSNSSEDFFKLWPADKSYFTLPHLTGFIAYKKVGPVLFCLADPIAATDDRPRLLQSFVAACRSQGWTACVLLVSETSRHLYRQAGLKTVQMGASAVVRVAEFEAKTTRQKWWRWQLNRATKAGLAYQRAMPPHSRSLLDETKTLSDNWLATGGHNEQGFALGYYDDDYLQRGPLHVLRDADGTLVAFANELPRYHQSTQATVDLIRFDPATNGAMPVLIAHLIRQLAAQGGIDSFDLGFVPLAKLDSRVAQLARRLVASRYSAAGLEQFKGKFEPDWQPDYVAYDGDLIDLTTIISRLETALKPPKT